jgi:Holliday junction resolvase RusA-like endonuclease
LIILDLPAPLSVNRTRRIDWSAKPHIGRWIKAADTLVMAQGRLPPRISGRFAVTVTMPEHGSLDLDNSPKQVIDYLRRLELVENDSPRFMRQVLLNFGEAPEGCRVTVQQHFGR